MSKTFRPYDPEQQLLLPTALQEWLPSDHLVYFVSDVVDQLDLSVIPSTITRPGLPTRGLVFARSSSSD
jgi:transposase